jgi:hypothetical protein
MVLEESPMEEFSPEDPIIQALDSEEVTDEQLGRIVRLHSNALRAPRVIVMKPSWYESAMAIGFIILIGVIAVGAYVNHQTTLNNRVVSKDVIMILCDRDRLVPGIEPSGPTIEACERNLDN